VICIAQVSSVIRSACSLKRSAAATLADRAFGAVWLALHHGNTVYKELIHARALPKIL
jgi:hypothetical protein